MGLRYYINNIEKIYLYKYYLNFNGGPILDYIIIKCKKCNNSELFDPLNKFIKNKKFKYSYIYGLEGNYIDYTNSFKRENNNDDYLFMDENI